ncbi:MAG: alanine--tRNA ligase [Acidobacteriota bacterium]|nr:alanine--tRNA ligase [Acidobacteriota bacterium]
MKSPEVRRAFLEFFARRDHQVVPSSPLILPADPTLLFANAGMNQFKELFTGRETRPYVRATSVQKCLRASGKHNDLEEVGRTPRHHTFFEMLGNFSFGDYFKRDAIVWAFELMTEVYGLPLDRLHVTVFRGDEEFPPDEEAARLWESETGMPRRRITELGRKDNFWQMGDTGPAGPCSEILYDTDPAAGADEHPGSAPERFVELWNLVFMQYDLQKDGSAEPLPAPSVDTGAGLERLCAVLQGARSNFDTDLFEGIIAPLAADAGRAYGVDAEADVSFRVIADHLRAIAMMVTEGVIPGPAKRGSVLRRVLRRALRHGRLLGLPSPFLHRHVGSVVASLGDAYPELRESREIIERVTEREERRFERTLADGFERLDERIGALLAKGERQLPGEEAFTLESERGLPLDLIKDALEERGLVLDQAEYETARRRHIETSRVLREGHKERADIDVYVPLEGKGSRFVGYESLRLEAARVVAIIRDGQPVDRLAEGERGEVLLDATPFYAESGGQIGDAGHLVGGDGRGRVVDTQSPLPGVISHSVDMQAGVLAVGQVVVAEVDRSRRAGAERHHTGTHLVHAALRQTLGPHVRQAGSLVTPERLRFDFSHFESVDPAALADIEDLSNNAVLSDLAVETETMSLDDALHAGALAFFGDRYGERVRVVRIGEFSMELCGGTHVERTGEIGPLFIGTERGVAAGVRRVEALAGPGALSQARGERELLAELSQAVGVSRHDLILGVERKLEELKKLQKENDELRMKLARGAQAADGNVTELDGLTVIARHADGLSRGQRRDLADSLRQKNPASVVVLGAAEGEKASLLVAIGSDVRGKIDAREVIGRLASTIGGGGGGKPDMAEAGGKHPDRLDQALGEAPGAVRALIAEG